MNKMIKCFVEHPDYEVLKETKNYYIFKIKTNNLELKVIPISDDKAEMELKDHFDE